MKSTSKCKQVVFTGTFMVKVQRLLCGGDRGSCVVVTEALVW